MTSPELRKNGKYRHPISKTEAIPSVNAIIEAVTGRPWLKNWAAKETRLAAAEHRDADGPDEEWLGAVAATARDRMTAAADRGSNVHNALETVIGDSLANGINYRDAYSGLDADAWTPLTAEARPYIEAGIDFLEQWRFEATWVERTVFGGDDYAGTPDLLGRTHRGLTLVDWKTGQKIDTRDTSLQLTAYAEADHSVHRRSSRAKWKIETLPDIDLLLVVHLRTDGNYVAHEIEPAPKAWQHSLELYRSEFRSRVLNPPRHEWLKQRIAELEPAALEALARRWPAGVPTFKQTTAQNEPQLDAIERTLDGIDQDHDVPFGAKKLLAPAI